MLEDVGNWLGIGASVATGGITGLIGVGLQSLFGFLNARTEVEKLKLQYAHETDMRKIDAEIVAKEWAGRATVAAQEAAGELQKANAQAFAASYTLEPQRYAEGTRPDGFLGRLGWFLLVLVDMVRGLIRPGLTLYLCVLTTLIYFEAKGLIAKEDLTASQALAITYRIIDTVLYLATTCVTWWFGTRANEAPQGLLGAPVKAKAK